MIFSITYSVPDSHAHTLPDKKVAHSPIALITKHICCGIVFDNLIQCYNIYFHPELHSFLAKNLYWWQEPNYSFSLFQHIPKTFNGVKVRTLWWPIHVWKWLLVFFSDNSSLFCKVGDKTSVGGTCLLCILESNIPHKIRKCQCLFHDKGPANQMHNNPIIKTC